MQRSRLSSRSRPQAPASAAAVLIPSLLLLMAVGCSQAKANSEAETRSADTQSPTTDAPGSSAPDAAAADLGEAVFAGGCFWCMEPPFDKLKGVRATTSGYIGGSKDDPTYKEVSSGGTGHTEAVRVTYDPTRISYQELLHVFWRNIDPTVENRQFCDWGDQYRTGIFYLDAGQRELAEASKAEIIATGRFEQVVTEITSATTFYPAEDYHQDFYKKSPAHYKRYRSGCGRDRRLAELWR